MHIETIPNRSSPPAILLRVGWREGAKVRKRTLANLTHWPAGKIEALRRVLRDEPLLAPGEVLTIERSLPHGHVAAVLAAMRRLGLAELISTAVSRPRQVVLAMIAQRVLEPCSKLASTRLWRTTTLGDELGVADAGVEELYSALDWLLARQKRIEAKLAGRHLGEGSLALYDVTSSSYEGRTCPLARFGHNRDGQPELPCIVYGVMTDGDGRPVGVGAYPGNTGDPTTVIDQVDKLRRDFSLERVVLVGDRGMLTGAQIRRLKEYPQLGWISALRSADIRKLVAGGQLQLSLFDQQDLAEIASADFPGERLMVCFNPLLAEQRRGKRAELLAATERDLDKIVKSARRRTRKLFTDDQLGLKAGKVLGRFKMAKHFELTIGAGRLTFKRDESKIAAESAVDGIYVIRTSEPAERLSAEDAVRNYKGLAHVERAFRTLKGIDLRVRPIYHRLEDHVRGHLLLCLLAYYVEWHMRQTLAELLFQDEELDDARRVRDPVKPAQPSAAVKAKKASRQTADGLEVHSFQTLLAELATCCRNRCRFAVAPGASGSAVELEPVEIVTEQTPLQARVTKLLEACSQYRRL
jgi:hypothetical protein